MAKRKHTTEWMLAVLPTVRMMGTASITTVADISVAFPTEPIKSKP